MCEYGVRIENKNKELLPSYQIKANKTSKLKLQGVEVGNDV